MQIMKKNLIVLCITFLLVSCSNTVDESSKLTVELNAQAQQHYLDGDFKNSISVYEKSLNITEDYDTRKLLQEINEEYQFAFKTLELRKRMQDFNTTINEGVSTVNKAIQVAVELEKILADLKELPTGGYQISNYTKELNHNPELISIELDLITLHLAIGKPDGKEIATRIISINKAIETLLAIEIPSKYDLVLNDL